MSNLPFFSAFTGLFRGTTEEKSFLNCNISITPLDKFPISEYNMITISETYREAQHERPVAKAVADTQPTV